MIYMKKRFMLIAMVIGLTVPMLSLTACFSEDAVEDEIDGVLKAKMRKGETTTETAEEGDVTLPPLHNSYIVPQSMGYDSSSPADCTVRASFNIKDFDLENNTLTFTAYEEEIYDAAEISLMQIGDTLKIDGNEIIVESIQDKDGDLIINGGFEEGGAELTPAEGGTYKAHYFDDYATYAELGKSTLPFNDELMITDSYKDASAPVEATLENLDKYLKGLTGASDSFNYTATTIEIAGGKVKSITRIWTP